MKTTTHIRGRKMWKLLIQLWAPSKTSLSSPDARGRRTNRGIRFDSSGPILRYLKEIWIKILVLNRQLFFLEICLIIFSLTQRLSSKYITYYQFILSTVSNSHECVKLYFETIKGTLYANGIGLLVIRSRTAYSSPIWAQILTIRVNWSLSIYAASSMWLSRCRKHKYAMYNIKS